MKTKRAAAITLEIPQNPLHEFFGMLQSLADDGRSTGSDLVSKIKSQFNNRNSRNNFKNYLPIIILGLVGFFALFFVGRFIISAFEGRTLGTSDSRVELKGPRAKTSLDKTYEFPLTDDKGKEIARLKFFLDDAELRDEIVLGGQKAVAPKGTTYLITTIKLTNTSNKFIEMRVRNYVRLSVNGNTTEWQAASIHNDPVEVQPQSTKLTRLGFPVNDTDKNLVLRVGDLEGKKETIKLDLTN